VDQRAEIRGGHGSKDTRCGAREGGHTGLRSAHGAAQTAGAAAEPRGPGGRGKDARASARWNRRRSSPGRIASPTSPKSMPTRTNATTPRPRPQSRTAGPKRPPRSEPCSGQALQVKLYRGSPGLLEVAGRARGRLESWQNPDWFSGSLWCHVAVNLSRSQSASGASSCCHHAAIRSRRPDRLPAIRPLTCTSLAAGRI
jgi:hypothetical protein